MSSKFLRRSFRGRSTRRTRRPPTVNNRAGVRQSGLRTSGGRRLPGPITVPIGQVITIQLTGLSGLTTNGTGIVGGIIPCDPSATLSAPFSSGALFPSFSYWSQLFTQIKCVQLDVNLVPSTTDEVKGDQDAVLAIAGQLSSTTAPTSYGNLMNNSDSQTYPILLDTRGLGRYHAIRHTRDLGWATTGTPVPDVNIYSGCPGGIGLYGLGFPVSTTISSIRITGTYKLRMWT